MNETQNESTISFTKLIRDIFSKGKENNNLGAQIEKNLHGLKSTHINSQLGIFVSEKYKDVLSITQAFIDKNKGLLKESLENNDIHTVKELVSESLMPQITAYLDTLDIGDDVRSNPLRRSKLEREQIFSAIKEGITQTCGGSHGNSFQVVQDAINEKLKDPCHSSAELSNKGKRYSTEVKISQETIDLMMSPEQSQDNR